MSYGQSSKEAEKQYLGRTGGSAWEREKPFSPPGDDTLAESLDLLQQFVVALTMLQPAPSDRVLDLGAGAGWCSDLLQRLNRRPVAVDISLEMLQGGRTRPSRRPIVAACGDFEHLPFLDGAFDKAICLNALHHVPDIPTAVREIFRVLSPAGVAVFSEPGAGHADMPTSIAATRDYGVLEQEVLIEPFIAMCRSTGFQDVRVCPMVYIIPEFDLSLDDWRAWQQLPRRKRPVRAIAKMWRSALEFAGVQKQSTLFEEAFAMRLVRLFQTVVEKQPYIVAAKREAPSRARAQYRATIRVEVPPVTTAGEEVTDAATVANIGNAPWRGTGTPDTGRVRLGIQLLDSTRRVVSRDFARADLGSDFSPGQSRPVTARFTAPLEAGDYSLKFDLVVEGVTWFEPTGSRAEIRPLRVAHVGGLQPSDTKRTSPVSEPRERSGDRGDPASERVGGTGGAKPPGQ